MTKGRILVIDDEPRIMRPCIKALTIQGYDAQGAPSGEKALALLEREPFDLLLLDLKMPGIDGLEVLRQAKSLRPGIGAIIITGYGTLEAATEAMRLGAADFVSKPLDMKALVAKVDDALKHLDHPEPVVHGNLRSMSLTSIVSITCNEGTQASLEIWHKAPGKDQLATIFFQDGGIVHAELDGQSGEEVIYRVLGWKEGDFVMTKGRAAPERTIHTGWSGLLLEGLRRIDEATQDQTLLPDEDQYQDEADTGIGIGIGDKADDDKIDEIDKIEPFAWPDSFEDNQETVDYELDTDFELQSAAPAMADPVAVKVKGILQDLSDSLDGFVAASVIGAAGLIADLVTDDTFDDERASAILAGLAQQAGRVSEAVNDGTFKENITATARYLFITRPLGQGRYYIRVIIAAGGNIGAARLYLKEYEETLLNTLLGGGM